MDMQQIGYFLYMEEQEKRQEQEKVNAEMEEHLEREQASQNEDEGKNKYLSRNIGGSVQKKK